MKMNVVGKQGAKWIWDGHKYLKESTTLCNSSKLTKLVMVYLVYSSIFQLREFIIPTKIPDRHNDNLELQLCRQWSEHKKNACYITISKYTNITVIIIINEFDKTMM